MAPIWVDIITTIDGLEFQEAWHGRIETRFANLPVAVLSLEHLIKNKTARGRLEDLADLEALRRIQEAAEQDHGD